MFCCITGKTQKTKFDQDLSSKQINLNISPLISFKLKSKGEWQIQNKINKHKNSQNDKKQNQKDNKNEKKVENSQQKAVVQKYNDLKKRLQEDQQSWNKEQQDCLKIKAQKSMFQYLIMKKEMQIDEYKNMIED